MGNLGNQLEVQLRKGDKTPKTTQKGVCKHWTAKGKCKFGEQCSFSHTGGQGQGKGNKGDKNKNKGKNNPPAAADQKEVCKNYLKGKCTNGGNVKDGIPPSAASTGQETARGTTVSSYTKSRVLRKTIIIKPKTRLKVKPKVRLRQKQAHRAS